MSARRDVTTAFNHQNPRPETNRPSPRTGEIESTSDTTFCTGTIEASGLAVGFVGDKSLVSSGQETVDHPEHYRPGPYEAIKVIEAWELDFHLGNAVKYIARAGRKSSMREDLEKAIWYLQRKIEGLEE